MKKALIGYSGFVGSNLKEQGDFTHFYNSQNINDIQNEEFDEIYCAGVSAVKWQANKDPEGDLQKINELLNNLSSVKAKRFVLISTVDVYKNPKGVDEDTPIELDGLHAYGKNRHYVEEFVKEHFDNIYIVRLPGLFGNGLKKNIIYDFLNNNCIEMIHSEGVFQFYYLKNIYKDIATAIENDIHLINFATEAVMTKDVVKHAFGRDFDQITENKPAIYDMQTKYAETFGKNGRYLYESNDVLEDVKSFVEGYKW